MLLFYFSMQYILNMGYHHTVLCNRHTTKEYVYITSNFPETFIQSDLHTLQYHRLHAYRSNMGLNILIKRLNL